MAGTRFIFAVVLIACFHQSTSDFFPDPDDTESILVIPHERMRRFVRIMSMKPDPKAEPETGIGWKGHVKNLLKGGSINVKISRPFLEKLAQYIPFLKILSKEEKKEYEMLEKEEKRRHQKPYNNINPRIREDEP